MEKIGSYYQSGIYERTAQAAKEAEAAKADRAKNTNAAKAEKKTPELSRAAQKALLMLILYLPNQL